MQITVHTPQGDRIITTADDLDENQINEVVDTAYQHFTAPSPNDEDHSFLDTVKENLPGIIKRVAPAIGGAMAGAAAGSAFPVVGTTIGGVLGGMLGGGGGEYYAEKGEVEQGKRPAINPYMVAVQGALSGVPGLPLAKGLSIPTRLAIGSAEGAGLGGVGSIGASYAEKGEFPTARELGTGALTGGTLGALGRLFRGKGTPQTVEPTAPSAPVIPPEPPTFLPSGFRGQVPLQAAPVEPAIDINRIAEALVAGGQRYDLPQNLILKPEKIPAQKPIIIPFKEIYNGPRTLSDEIALAEPPRTSVGASFPEIDPFSVFKYERNKPPVEIPSGFRGTLPTPSAPEPVINLEQVLDTIIKAEQRQGVPSILDLPSPYKGPLIIPKTLGGSRTPAQDLRLSVTNGLEGAQSSPTAHQLPENLFEGYQAEPQGAGVFPVLPGERSPLAKPEGALPLPAGKGFAPDPNVIELPSTFEPKLLPQNAVSLKDKSLLDIIKQSGIFSERGSINAELSPQQLAARQELNLRIVETTKKTGKTADEVLQAMIRNPNGFQQELSGAKKLELPRSFLEEPQIVEPSVIAAPPPVPPTTPRQLPKNFDKTGSPNERTVAAYQEALVAPKNWLSRLGPAGEQINHAFRNTRNDERAFNGKWLTQAEEVLKQTTDEEFSNLTKVQEGKLPADLTTAPKLQALKTVLNDVAQTAKSIDPNFTPLEDYWRHTAKPEFYDELRKKFIKFDSDGAKVAQSIKVKIASGEQVSYGDWLRSKGFKDDEIPGVINSIMQRDKVFEYGPLKFKRRDVIPEEFLRRDKGVLVDYLRGSAKHLAERRNLGEDFANIRQLQAALKDKGNIKLVEDIINKHQEQRRGPITRLERILDKARSFNVISLLDPLSTLTNYSQRVVNPQYVRGVTAKTYAKARIARLTSEGKKFAKEAGTIYDDFIDTIDGGFKSKNSWATKWLTLLGHARAEKGNRIVGANLGKEIAIDMFTKAKKGNAFAASVLEGLGIDPEAAIKRGSLTSEEIIRAALNVDDEVNFGHTVLDVPLGMSGGPTRRALTQFGRTAYQQSDFIARAAMNALRQPHKSGIAFLSALLTTAAAGGVNLGASKLIKNEGNVNKTLKEIRHDPKAFIAQALTRGPGLGYASDIATNAAYSKTGAAAALLGPTVGLASELGYDATQVVTRKKKKFNPLLKTLTTRIPLGRRVLPQFIK